MEKLGIVALFLKVDLSQGFPAKTSSKLLLFYDVSSVKQDDD